MKYYWHFCRNDKKLGFGDCREIHKGRTLKVKVEPILCRQGLHASKKVIDALRYAQGDIICKVTLGDVVKHDTDKFVATERTVVAWANAEKLLHEFACLCAERALKKRGITDKGCWDAIKAKRDWLQGRITNKQLDTERYAERSVEMYAVSAERYVAWSADRYAAESAAYAAPWSAERHAAWAMGGYAAWFADRSAVCAAWAMEKAGYAAERKWQNKTLMRLISQVLDEK